MPVRRQLAAQESGAGVRSDHQWYKDISTEWVMVMLSIMSRPIFADSVQRCTDCGCVELELNSREAELTCTGCGLVLASRMMDMRSEWNTYDTDAENGRRNPSRVGDCVGMIDLKTKSTLRTQIVNKPGDKAAISFELQHAQTMCDGRHDARIREDRTMIDCIVTNLQLPASIGEEALAMFIDFGDAIKPKTVRGAVRHGVISACVYFSCRAQKLFVRSLEEVCACASLSKRSDLSKGFKLIEKTFSQNSTYRDIIFSTSTASDTLVRKVQMIVSAHKDRFPVVRTSRLIEDKLRASNTLSTKQPEKLVASIIWVAMEHLRLKTTKREVMRACNVSEATMDVHVKAIRDVLDASPLA